jgi:hypothetical protein
LSKKKKQYNIFFFTFHYVARVVVVMNNNIENILLFAIIVIAVVLIVHFSLAHTKFSAQLIMNGGGFVYILLKISIAFVCDYHYEVNKDQK